MKLLFYNSANYLGDNAQRKFLQHGESISIRSALLKLQKAIRLEFARIAAVSQIKRNFPLIYSMIHDFSDTIISLADQKAPNEFYISTTCSYLRKGNNRKILAYNNAVHF